MKKVELEGIKSPLITEQDDLKVVLKNVFHHRGLNNGDILVIASKVVAVTQKRTRFVANREDFEKLVRQEADFFLGGEMVDLTVKDNIFIAWAGIDRSNVQKGFVVLWPEKPFKVAEKLRKELQEIFQIKQLGVLITDSCCTPLRNGVSGVALGYSGFEGVRDMRGHKDLYGNELKVTQQAVADNLATAAHLVMGESDERTPFVLIRGAPVVFTNKKIDRKSLSISQEKCLFNPLYQNI